MLDRFDKEFALYNNGADCVIGVDEVGRGPLAGPVVASAVCFAFDGIEKLRQQNWWNEITDSKKLSEKKREYLFEHITTNSQYSIAVASVMEIESINILQGSLLAMRRAVEELQKKLQIKTDKNIPQLNSVILIDGKNIIPNLNYNQKAIVKGDSVVHSIAASSIIAKVYRDRLMKELSEQFPEYGLEKHKGYGTKFHIEAIRKFGLSPIHRASFCGNIV